MKVSRKSVIVSLIWKFLERVGTQLSTFILGIILARILSPTEYGTVSLITVFISIATVFVQGGFNTALIQRKQAQDIDFSSILYFSLGVAMLLYAVLFFCAPLIASFYRLPELIPIVRVLALSLIPGAFNSIQVAYITRRMQFRKLFVSTLAASILSGLLGIFLAKRGAGAWAIVAQQLGTQVIVCLFLLLLSDWRPKLVFSMQSVRNLIPFGSRILASNLLISLYTNIRSLLIGRVYSKEDLAFFNRGHTFPATLMEAVNGSIQSVMLPTFSSVQDDLPQLRSMLRRSVRISAYIVFPLLVGLAAVAGPFIRLVLTEKWAFAIPYLQIFALGYLTHPIQISTNQALKACGRSDLSLRIEIFRKILETVFLCAAIPLGPRMIAWSSVVSSLSASIVSAPVIRKHLSYGYAAQFRDLMPATLLSTAMLAAVYGLGRLTTLSDLPTLAYSILVGAAVYVVLSALTRNDSFCYLVGLIRRRKEPVDA